VRPRDILEVVTNEYIPTFEPGINSQPPRTYVVGVQIEIWQISSFKGYYGEIKESNRGLLE
jgi:hypothetical protein